MRPGRVLTLNCVQPDPPDPWASGDVRGASPRPREGAEMGCARGPDLTLNQVPRHDGLHHYIVSMTLFHAEAISARS